MKKLFYILLCLIISNAVFAQSKKDIKLYKIKSTTTWQADNSNGTAVTHKDSYEEFDKYGNTTMLIEYKSDGSIKNKTTYTYTNGNKTEESEYNASGALTKKITYTYNANGDKTGEIVTDASGNITKKITYTYDAKGLKITKQVFNAANILVSVTKYEYKFE